MNKDARIRFGGKVDLDAYVPSQTTRIICVLIFVLSVPLEILANGFLRDWEKDNIIAPLQAWRADNKNDAWMTTLILVTQSCNYLFAV